MLTRDAGNLVINTWRDQRRRGVAWRDQRRCDRGSTAGGSATGGGVTGGVVTKYKAHPRPHSHTLIHPHTSRSRSRVLPLTPMHVLVMFVIFVVMFRIPKAKSKMRIIKRKRMRCRRFTCNLCKIAVRIRFRRTPGYCKPSGDLSAFNTSFMHHDLNLSAWARAAARRALGRSVHTSAPPL